MAEEEASYEEIMGIHRQNVDDKLEADEHKERIRIGNQQKELENLNLLNLSNLQLKLIKEWAEGEKLSDIEAITKLVKIGFKSVFDGLEE